MNQQTQIPPVRKIKSLLKALNNHLNCLKVTIIKSAACEARTHDLEIMRLALYRLSQSRYTFILTAIQIPIPLNQTP